MRIRTLSLLGALLTVSAAASAQEPMKRWEQGERLGSPVPGLERLERLEGTGIIQYDPGSPDGTRTAGQGFTFLGNLFDTRNGSPLSPGTITQIQWYNGNAGAKGSDDMFLGIFPDGGGNVTDFIDSVDSFAFNTYALSVGPLGGSPVFVGFYAGVGPTEGPPVSIGYASGSYNGQGFHGSQRTFSGVVGSSIPSQNMVIRITGSLVVPVELLEFDLD